MGDGGMFKCRCVKCGGKTEREHGEMNPVCWECAAKSDPRPSLAAELRRAEAATAKGQWSLTRYSGGLSFDGPERVYCGTNEVYGEPQIMPNTEADHQFVHSACRHGPTALLLLQRIRAHAEQYRGTVYELMVDEVVGMIDAEFAE